MISDDFSIGNGRVVCSRTRTVVEKLLSKGFLMLNNGDYQDDNPEDAFRPDPDSLYFRLLSPTDLNTIDLAKDTYELASLGDNLYMCECHYHLVKIVTQM